MAIIPRRDPNDFRCKIKTPTLKESERREIVISALMDATENNTVGGLNLSPNSKNKLDKLYRYEILSTLEVIAKQGRSAFAVNESNYGKEIVPENEREASIVFTGRAKNSEPIYRPAPLPENTPILLTLLRGFDNWRYSYLHKKTIKLSDLSSQNFEKVRSTVVAIDDKFQLNSTPDIEIRWNNSWITDSADARMDALNFLLNKSIITQFDFIDGRIDIILNVKEFQSFKGEVYKLSEKTLLSKPAENEKPIINSEKNPFGNRKWEEITIQFLDGNNAKITAKNIVVKAHYKEMGFEDARSRKPDQQWELLRLLAEHNGELSWGNSEASDAIKKKKQLLSKSLQKYFSIESDPFHPYKEQSSYRLKITLLSESDQQ